jgi:hypothetical protein
MGESRPLSRRAYYKLIRTEARQQTWAFLRDHLALEATILVLITICNVIVGVQDVGAGAITAVISILAIVLVLLGAWGYQLVSAPVALANAALGAVEDAQRERDELQQARDDAEDELRAGLREFTNDLSGFLQGWRESMPPKPPPPLYVGGKASSGRNARRLAALERRAEHTRHMKARWYDEFRSRALTLCDALRDLDEPKPLFTTKDRTYIAKAKTFKEFQQVQNGLVLRMAMLDMRASGQIPDELSTVFDWPPLGQFPPPKPEEPEPEPKTDEKAVSCAVG